MRVTMIVDTIVMEHAKANPNLLVVGYALMDVTEDAVLIVQTHADHLAEREQLLTQINNLNQIIF